MLLTVVDVHEDADVRMVASVASSRNGICARNDDVPITKIPLM